MWEKRIGAAGAILAGGIAFVVLAVFLERISDQAAQWMQAVGTLLAFAGLLYVHWNEGARRQKEQRDAAALAASLIGREMRRISMMAAAVVEDHEVLNANNFVWYFDAIKEELAHHRSSMFLDKLSPAHTEAAQFVGFVIDHLAEFWKNLERARSELLAVDANYMEIMIKRLKAVADCGALAFACLESDVEK